MNAVLAISDHQEMRRLDASARWQAFDAQGGACRRSDAPAAAGTIVWRSWGSGPDLVLLHGSAGSWTHWLRNIDALARHHTVHAVDLPGNGDSGPHVGEKTLDALATAVLSSFDRLRSGAGQAPGAPISVVGFSFGSFIAEAIALQRPAEVEHLVLARGTFTEQLPPMPTTLRRWRHLLDDPLALREAHRHNLATLMFRDPARIDDLAMAAHAHNQVRAALDVGAFMPSRPVDALKRLRVAPCCITGEFDVLAGGAAAEQGAELHAQRPDATFHLIQGSGHWTPYEAADTFNALLEDELATRRIPAA